MPDTIPAALRRGDAAAALAAARSAVQARPDDAEAHHQLGLAQLITGEREAAARSIDQALALAPDQPLYHMSLSILAVGAGDLQAAAAALDQAVALDPNQLPAYVAQSQLALARGDIAEAEQRLLRALRVDDEHPQVLLGLGNLRLAQRDLDGALKAFTHAVKVAPDDAVAHTCLGVAYLKRGTLNFAEQALRNALSQRANHGAARRALIEVLLRQGRRADAAGQARALLEADADNATAWRLLGDIEAAEGNTQAADEALAKAAGLAPDDLVTLRARVRLWTRSGERERARALLEQRLAADPQSEPDWQLRLSVERGDRVGSIEVATRWHAACPESAAATEMLAQIAEARGEQERAESLADAALLLDADRIAAHLIKARAEIRRAPEQALQRLEPLARRTRDVRLLRPLLGWLGHAADAAGQQEQAVRHWLAAHALSDVPGRLPPLGAVDEQLDAAVQHALQAAPGAGLDDPAQPPPTLLLGAPGASSERLAALLRGQAQRPLLDDRFGPQRRNDRFMRPDYERWMANDRAAIAEFGSSWRAGLQARGLAGVPVIDWLQRWDARLLPPIAQALPGTRFVVAMRDPRDTLLNWLAFGAPQRWPLRDLDNSAEWLALELAHLWQIGRYEGFSLAVISMEELELKPEQVLPQLCTFLELEQPPDPSQYLQSLTATAGWPTALPHGAWRRYAAVLEKPFAALAPVVRAFGYPES